ncbi:cold-inducible RNA-binding protein B-like [Lissotriton helveticus]
MSSDGRKLSIGNLSLSTEEETLKGAFSKYGKIESVLVAKTPGNLKNRGFGFVTFESEDDAKAALQAMNGEELDGHKIRVEHVGKSSDRSPGTYSGDSGQRRGYQGGGRGGIGDYGNSGGGLDHGRGGFTAGGYGSRESYGSGQSGGYE